MATHLVWDWNGTLLDDLDCCVQVTNQLLGEFGLPRLSGVAEYRAKFGFPVVDYYNDLGFDPSPGGTFEAASRRYLELYLAAARSCVLHDGAAATIRTLHRHGIRQVVISASEQQNLLAQLAPFRLEAWLDGAYGLTDIYAASKQAIAQRWLLAEGLDPTDVIFVGDSEHDHEIATALGAGCVLFTGGHHGRDRLSRLGAPLIEGLPELLAHL